MRIQKLVAGGLCVITALIIASIESARPYSVGAAELAHVTVINTPSDSNGEVYYAQDRGFFKKYGLDVTITNLTSGAAVAAAMASGQYDIANGNVATVAAAREAGLPFVYIAPGAMYNDDSPTTALVVVKDSPIKSATDLVGKTIANVSLQDIGTVALDSWLARQHVDPAQIHVVELPLSAMGASLDRGTISAAIMLEPFLSASLAQNTRILSKIYSAVAPQFLINAYYARPDWVDSHRDEARAFQRAITDAAQWANSNQAASAEILAKTTNVNITPNQARATYSTALTAPLLQPLIDAAVSTKMLKTPLNARALLRP
jgi:NitT/TauT family transport system substrate-binding protein